MGESARGLLTHHGVRGLFWNSSTSNDVRLQVLGVYRYLVDPALKQRLGPEIEGERDAFDILLSDGIHKMKAVLSPALNELVWKRDIAVQKIISVTKFGVFNEDPEDEQRKQRICVLLEVSVVDIGDNVEVSEKIFDRRFGAYNRQECLDFVSTAHPRDVELVPLAGERLYYLPLRSDHYVLDWACSFTDGVAEKESPLDELEINWASRYAGMVAADDAVGDHAPKRTLAMTWNTTPIYCASLFTDKLKRIPKVLEALEMIETGSNPPLTGAVRVKSKVIHVGDPNIPNSFPFVFNIILVDTQGAFEVAFYGSMCAKYFLSLHEGDLIQLRGYSSIYPREIGSTTSITPVLYYEHESSGSVFHVPKADLFKEAFGLEVLPFRDLARLLSKMEDLEHQHVGVVARVLNVRTMVNTDDASKARKILLELSEDSGEDGQDLSKENEANMLTVHAAGNPLYQTATIKGSIKTITPRESLPLIRLLPPDITDDMYTKAVKSLPGSKLSLEFIKNYLSSVNKEYLFSVHLFQDAERETRWEVDAILHHKL
ncbi:hypothetical protein PHYBOEH_003753 [Phytophthora boehmeriae]|uniref:Uncharacterized protein n=1 Tax=Phytophthora boehmeriae TaxID=109152 RepID=A0A8T1WND9_9STRA|nr:hypothetical protein PHYBOEH_003753 [Phytophthora boehmeriae]